MPARCPSDCPVVVTAKDAAAFNTHSPGGGGSGLAQQVFRSPARIPASEAGRKGLCAAPASEKRYSFYARGWVGSGVQPGVVTFSVSWNLGGLCADMRLIQRFAG